jgi:hypothetical protein
MCEWNRWQLSDALAGLDVIRGRTCCPGLRARAGERAARCFAVKSGAGGQLQVWTAVLSASTWDWRRIGSEERSDPALVSDVVAAPSPAAVGRSPVHQGC